MSHLTRHDYAAALRLLAGLESDAREPEAFVRACMLAVSGFVACEAARIELRPGPRANAGSDGARRREAVLTIDASPGGHAAIVLRRRGSQFSERDRERLELLRPHLAFLYRHALGGDRLPSPAAQDTPAPPATPRPAALLTEREGQVLHWLSCGKTDAEIAAFLAISPRTVHKHLEHIYVKLGVETRTAAVMRAQSLVAPPARP